MPASLGSYFGNNIGNMGASGLSGLFNGQQSPSAGSAAAPSTNYYNTANSGGASMPFGNNGSGWGWGNPFYGGGAPAGSSKGMLPTTSGNMQAPFWMRRLGLSPQMPAQAGPNSITPFGPPLASSPGGAPGYTAQFPNGNPYFPNFPTTGNPASYTPNFLPGSAPPATGVNAPPTAAGASAAPGAPFNPAGPAPLAFSPVATAAAQSNPNAVSANSPFAYLYPGNPGYQAPSGGTGGN